MLELRGTETKRQKANIWTKRERQRHEETERKKARIISGDLETEP